MEEKMDWNKIVERVFSDGEPPTKWFYCDDGINRFMIICRRTITEVEVEYAPIRRKKSEKM